MNGTFHSDRKTVLIELEKELRGLPDANHPEIQVAQNCAAMALLLDDAEDLREPKKVEATSLEIAEGTGETAVK